MHSSQASLCIASPALLQREVDFARAAWRAGLRPDRRGALQLRDVVVEFPLPARDAVVVRCGATVVTATVSCALVEPAPARPRHGLLEFSVQRAATERDGPASAQAADRTAALLERLVRAGGVVDTEGLCVVPGRRAWSVAVDVCVLCDEGGAADAAVWAALAALMHCRRPELTVRGADVVVHPPHERAPVPLSLHHAPLAFTFAVAAGPLGVVADPSMAEAAAAAAEVVVAVNAEGQVCAVHKAEGVGVQADVLRRCVEAATGLAPQVMDTIRTAMKAHDTRREEAMREQFLWAQKRSGVARAEAQESTVGADA